MGGRQQHYVPQFLQRAFACEERGGETYVAVYRKGRNAPFLSNTAGVGQQRDFYGRSDGVSVDDAITLVESQLACTAHALDQCPLGTVALHDIALLFGALSMRTKAMRDAMQRLAPNLLKAVQAKVADPDEVRRVVRSALTNEHLVEEAIEAELVKRPAMNRTERRRAKKYLRREMRNKYKNNERQHTQELRHLLDNVLDNLKMQATTIADGAVLQALGKDPLMPERARGFEKFTFEEVGANSTEPFILGDCVAWALYSDGKPHLALGDIDDSVRIEQIVLPISPRRCIIGARGQMPGALSVRQINEASASLSLEMFVSNDMHAESMRQLQPLIGTALPYLETDAIMQFLK